MKKRGAAALLAAICLLAGCAASDPALPAETPTPTETSSPAYQGDSESPIVSTDTRGLTFVTAQGDTYSFWFDKRRFEGVDGRCYVLSEDEKLWELVWGIRAADPDYQDLMR